MERPLRLAEFDDLFATAVRGVQRVGEARLRMAMSGPAGLGETVRDLTARESECCSFFTFTITPEPATGDEALTLDITVPAAYTEVLESLARRAESVAWLQERAGRLGIPEADLRELASAWRSGDCPVARDRLEEALASRSAAVEGEIAALIRRATEAGAGSAEWARATADSLPVTEQAARLQAASAALAGAGPHAGRCGPGCPCGTALSVPAGSYRIAEPASDGQEALTCDLVADGGEAGERIGAWQRVLARVRAREPLPDTATGLALRFPLDLDLAAAVARLAAAEYRCCSFGSYTLVIDGTGLTLEVRMPEGAADLLAAVLGTPDRPRAEAAA
ncbi:hypothetical protein GCM10023170_053790 [Phytohabitans houttuyneae]|uniref:Uncharacterized protein n=1 Tax=Phytohabitans houttuyneae TaxID=1076126 RepID=A0A6V8KIQ2_9ACTN|nr:hypothetical protein Phou_065110 [Phytohabitans houttuyneae]